MEQALHCSCAGVGSHLAAVDTKTGSVGDVWGYGWSETRDGRAYALPVEMSCDLVDKKVSQHTREPSCLSTQGNTLGWHPGQGIRESVTNAQVPASPMESWLPQCPSCPEYTWMGGESASRQAHIGLQTRTECIQQAGLGLLIY